MYIIEWVYITKHVEWNGRNGIVLLNIEQVGDVENCDRLVYPIHHDQDDWRCVKWNEEYDGC